MIKSWIASYWRPALGLLLGAVAGYAYWYFYGCDAGCTITGSPWNSSLYFAFMGYLLQGLFTSKATNSKAV